MLDRPTVKAIAKDIEEAVQAVAEKHGVTIRSKGASWRDLVANVRLTIETTTSDGKKPQEVDFARHAAAFGLPADLFGKTIKFFGEDHIVDGLNPRRYKFPVSLTRVKDGKKYKSEVAGIMACLRLKEEENK